jgi:hypothetical protein
VTLTLFSERKKRRFAFKAVVLRPAFVAPQFGHFCCPFRYDSYFLNGYAAFPAGFRAGRVSIAAFGTNKRLRLGSWQISAAGAASFVFGHVDGSACRTFYRGFLRFCRSETHI